jgi:hypothetical protein
LLTNSVETQQATKAPAVAGCAPTAWDCQMHTYLGSPENVTANLAAVPNSLTERRVYMLMVQGDDHAEAHLFERFAFGDEEATIAQWSDHKLGDMVSRLTEVLVGNGGVHCPGEQVKAHLEAEHKFAEGALAPAPKNSAEAFGPVMAGFAGDKFVQATVMALC